MATAPSPSSSFRRAALFVDFENVYIGLRNSSPEAAERFANLPSQWVQWMEQALGPFLVDLDEQPRTILRRICYLEPVHSGKYRVNFTRAGFRVVDCPTLTAAGKNSADIHMVLDILDTLSHPTWFDDFIVLSVDADFTPVLLRLREHDRRTAMLVSGPAAAALRAACDFAIPDSMFVDEALGLGLDEPSAGHVPIPAPTNHHALRERMEAIVRELVADSSRPVALARAAHEIRRSIGAEVDTTSWGGHGTFGAFAAAITDDQLHMHTSRPPGWLFDPNRHSIDQVIPASPAGLPDVADQVNRVLGVPLLASETYQTLFEVIATDARAVASQGHTEAERRTRDACGDRGHPVSRPAVHFVLLSFQGSGTDWRSPEAGAATLAKVFAENVLRLASSAQMNLDDDSQDQIRQWIGRAQPSETAD